MSNTYQIYLISDSTGETLDRIFLAIKAQFKNINYKVHPYSFTRTENQILKILSDAESHASHSQTEHFKELGGALAPFLAGAPEITVHEEIK